LSEHSRHHPSVRRFVISFQSRSTRVPPTLHNVKVHDHGVRGDTRRASCRGCICRTRRQGAHFYGAQREHGSHVQGPPRAPSSVGSDGVASHVAGRHGASRRIFHVSGKFIPCFCLFVCLFVCFVHLLAHQQLIALKIFRGLIVCCCLLTCEAR
jgi:hypothetical protein